MQCFLLFLNIDTQTDIENFFNETYGQKNYTAFNEVSSSGKEHVHICLISNYKKDTIQKHLTKKFPSLKRPPQENGGSGGEHRYTVKRFPEDYKSEKTPYPEYPQDYITKDSSHRSGLLWSQTNSSNYHSKSLPQSLDYIEWVARYDRYTKWTLEHPSTKPKPKIEKNTESSCQKFEKYINSFLAQDIRYFYQPDKPFLDRTQLKNVIIMYYRKNGKPSNRNVAKVIAEQVIFYGNYVCPEDQSTHDLLSQAIDTEIENMTRSYS